MKFWEFHSKLRKNHGGSSKSMKKKHDCSRSKQKKYPPVLKGGLGEENHQHHLRISQKLRPKRKDEVIDGEAVPGDRPEAAPVQGKAPSNQGVDVLGEVVSNQGVAVLGEVVSNQGVAVLGEVPTSNKRPAITLDVVFSDKIRDYPAGAVTLWINRNRVQYQSECAERFHRNYKSPLQMSPEEFAQHFKIPMWQVEGRMKSMRNDQKSRDVHFGYLVDVHPTDVRPYGFSKYTHISKETMDGWRNQSYIALCNFALTTYNRWLNTFKPKFEFESYNKVEIKSKSTVESTIEYEINFTAKDMDVGATTASNNFLTVIKVHLEKGDAKELKSCILLPPAQE